MMMLQQYLSDKASFWFYTHSYVLKRISKQLNFLGKNSKYNFLFCNFAKNITEFTAFAQISIFV